VTADLENESTLARVSGGFVLEKIYDRVANAPSGTMYRANDIQLVRPARCISGFSFVL